MLPAHAAVVSLAVLVAHGMLHCSVRRIITVIAVTATLARLRCGCRAVVHATPAVFAMFAVLASPAVFVVRK